MSATGVNPNAKPFVPSFAMQPPQQPAPASLQQSSYRPPQPTGSFAPAAASAAPFYPQHHHHHHHGGYQQPALPSYFPARPLYPGLSSNTQPPQYQNHQAPPQAAPRATYDQMLKSRGTPGSKVLSPDEAFVSTPPPEETKTAPVALLFLGPRGSGKSTQAKLAADAMHLLFVSAGDLIREKKHPFLELRRIVQENFGPNMNRYRGVSLDRFIVNGESDVYYLQWALGSIFGVPRVFLLMLDWEVALARADARSEESRVKSTQRRMMEYRAHFDACENIYAKVGVLDRIDCESYSQDAVHSLIMTRLDAHTKAGKLHLAASSLPPACLDKSLSTIRLISDFERYTTIKADVHHALGSTNYELAPVSAMSGVIDQSIIDDARIRRPLSAYFVTLKADGQRLIVVKHTSGIIGFPQKFTGAYDLSNLFAAVQWPPKPPTESEGFAGRMGDLSPVEWIMDCEVMRMPNKTHPTILAFDFIYFYGSRAVSERFSVRLKRLQDYFAQLTYSVSHAPKIFELKEYVQAGKLRKLLPDYNSAPFTVDGVVFQADSNYRYGADKTMCKWKPQGQCTVDFRLYGCREPQTKGGDWTFEAKAQEVKTEGDKTVNEEVTVPNVIITIPHKAVVDEQLSDGAIVECAKLPPAPKAAPAAGKNSAKAAAPAVETWVYYKNRPDKLVPNRMDIVTKVATMHHITYEQLLSVCDTFKS
jgi:hypothetical protein